MLPARFHWPCAGAAAAGPAEPTVAEPTNSNAPPGAKDNFDPTYNVCRGTDPRCYHPWVDDRENKVLLYTRTAGPRHANIGPALAAGLNPPLGAGADDNVAAEGHHRMAGRGGRRGRLDRGRHAPAANLNRYKAVIFVSTSRDTLWKHGTAVGADARQSTRPPVPTSTPAKTALRQYIRAGGGFVGIHNAFGTEYNWPWYEGLLGNANYYDHGANPGRRRRDRRQNDSSTNGLPQRFGFMDEWYNLVPYPDEREVPGDRRRGLARDASARRTPATATSIPSPGASTTTAAARG